MSLLNLTTAGITCIAVFGSLFVLGIVYLCFVPMKTYFMVLFSGCYIPTFKLIGLRCRKLNIKEIATLYVGGRKAKLKISLKDIEGGISAGADVQKIIEGMTLLSASGKGIDFQKALGIEMATKNFLTLAKDSLVSKVCAIEDITATTKDGYELKVKVNISAKANLDKFASALGLDEVKNTVSACIIDRISSCEKKETILSQPNKYLCESLNIFQISQKSIYRLEDIKIAGIEISRDLNAEKEIKAVEKEKMYASIEAERMKNAEEIRLIQSKAKIESMKAQVLEAEADVPKALSSAIKEGRFSVMDYYKLMNLQADTALRRAIIGDDEGEDDEE